ncbi:MAG: type II toxin-antitoxin system HicA family toxin [Bryobacteraceae bacterium]|jgi:predicted RNA binding protein YcfA (HicA-like mRNA interferase family)
MVMTRGGIMWKVKVRDLIHRLESAGWRLKATKGSPRQYLHPQKGMVVTVPGQAGKDVPAGTLKAILRSAGLEGKEED